MMDKIWGLFIGNGKFQFNKDDVISILKGAGIAALGAGLIYAIEGVAHLDFGIWTAAITALGGILVNLVRKWLSTNKQ